MAGGDPGLELYQNPVKRGLQRGALCRFIAFH